MDIFDELIERLNNCNGKIRLTDREIGTIRTALRMYKGIENALDEELGLGVYHTEK